MTHIDRINYFSDGFIEYYTRWFNIDEFCFLINHKKYEKIVKYLCDKGFSTNQMFEYRNKNYKAGEKKRIQAQKKNEFLRKGYTVVYSSQDERIVHPDLRNYIINNLKDYIVPRGVVIIQHPTESKLDVTKPLLSQRSYQVHDVRGRSKPQILKKNVNWDSGMHNIPKGAEIDENIFLVDIGKCCIDMTLENNFITLSMYKDIPYFYITKTREDVEKHFNEKPCVELPEALKATPTLF